MDVWLFHIKNNRNPNVIDCAMNAGAIVVTENVKDFRLAEKHYGLVVMKSDQFLAELFK